MKNSQETKFYETLKNVFTGVPIEGEGGYVNLLKIKQKYYEKVLDQFKSEVDTNAIVCGFKEDFFNTLYTFFERYFSECGSIYFTKTASWQKVYEKIYTNEKDVVLFWKTNMLYYVKSDTLYQNTILKIDYNGRGYVFKFDVNNLQQKQNNEKVGLKYTYKEFSDKNTSLHDNKCNNGTYIIDVETGKQTNALTETIIKETKLPEEVIEKAIDKFKRQTSVDYFINKNAKTFLEEQLDLFLNQILLDTSSQFDQNRLDQLKAVKEFALKLIAFISQFEDELVFIWNKPKFVRNSNYVISLDLISDNIKAKIRNHKGLPAQIQEWKDLKLVDDSFSFQEMELLGNPSLPIDTKHFKDLELEIIGQFENLDDALNGRLINSENYQALNTLQKRYKEQLQCVYIDPPFNTGSDFAYLDNYQDSTWLSIMSDRIALAKKMLKKNGSFYTHLDYNASHIGRVLLDETLGSDNFINEIIWDKGFRGTESKNIYQHAHDVIFYYSQNNNKEYIWNQHYQPYKDENLGRYNKIDENGKQYALIKRTRTDGTVYYGRTYPKEQGKCINDVISHIATMASTNKERRGYDTQKPEQLLEIFLSTSSQVNEYVLDFFDGSGTTTAVSHKLRRKYIGIEMGDVFSDFYYETIIIKNTDNNLSNLESKYEIIKKEIIGSNIYATVRILGLLGRMKEVVANCGVHEPCGISEQTNWQGGGFFKYYQLEQYEDVLRRARYNDNTVPYSNEVYDKYIFFADDKFADTISVNGNNIDIDLSKLYNDIDLPETISLLLGKPIIKITEDEVVLEGVQKPIKYNVSAMSNDEKKEFIQLVKPLLWWGKNN